MNEPCVGPTIPGRINGLLAPLQESLRIGECAFFFSMACRREKENFGLDVLGLQLAAVDLGRFAPEIRRFDFDHVANDQPFQFRQRLSLEPRIGCADGWVLSHQKHALHFSVQHVVKEFEERMVPREFGKPTVAEIVFCGRVRSVIGLESADDVFRVMSPETGLF